MLWDEFCFATTQPLPDAELEKLQAEEAAARRRICEGLCGPTLAPLLQDACARVSTPDSPWKSSGARPKHVATSPKSGRKPRNRATSSSS